jgi:hypothetical protein
MPFPKCHYKAWSCGLFGLVALSLLLSCGIVPTTPLTTDNPANPSAPIARMGPHDALGDDDLTLKSRGILAQAAKQQLQWDQSGPDSSDQQAQQMQDMPGMKMPQEQSQPSQTPHN